MATGEKATIVKAIHAYTPVNNDELKLGKGDIITVTQKEDGGWWEGTLNGRTGWFPSNYVTEHISPSGIATNDTGGSFDKSTPTKKMGMGQGQLQNSSGVSLTLTEEQLKYRLLIISDLIETEEAFINEMREIWVKYLQPLQNTTILTSAEMSILTGNINEIIHCHDSLLLGQLQNEQEFPLKDQRIGKLFLDMAEDLELTHRTYSSNHPKAVQLIEKHKEDLNAFMDSRGDPSGGTMTILTGLSQPFRRFERYPILLQEIERHIEESHKDRGDLQRSIEYYKEIDKSCGALRKQKEMELEVLNGTIAGWEGNSEISQLGEIIYMSLVHIGQDLQPRYFVLFTNTLLILSYNSENNTLGYEGKIPVSGITLPPINEKNKHLSDAFEIAGPMIEGILVSCGSKVSKETWLNNLNKVLKQNRFPSYGSSPSQSYGQLAPPIQAWSISRLRPNPPANPLLVESHQNQFNHSNGNKSTPKKTNDTGKFNGNIQQLSHEEDLTILSIVDAFCSSNRQTSGGGGSSGQVDIKPRTLAEVVWSLRDEVAGMKTMLTKVSKTVEEEQKARNALQQLVQSHLNSSTPNHN